MEIKDTQKQMIEWKRKGWSIPELRGSKQEWYEIVHELIEKLADNSAVDMNSTPDLKATSSVYPWRNYAPFLKGIGLASNKAGLLTLTDIGKRYWD